MTEYLQQNWLEVLGTITSLICVWLNTRQNIWGWFWAIVSSGIYAVIFWQSNLKSPKKQSPKTIPKRSDEYLTKRKVRK